MLGCIGNYIKHSGVDIVRKFSRLYYVSNVKKYFGIYVQKNLQSKTVNKIKHLLTVFD
ncbi:DUF2129 domain-containing protein [Staphylococcus xylosus]|uniref:DUF2129 domain-containing protein n=1 Tax=Staphylococcus xylosus TaxID=1288 RepID=A0AAQ0LZD0_STAXY|nr:DUF2129 domain-containing protein [Staphylococcus xylosus]PTH99900.1 hypothetical protein BU105_07200 [Staphylococcus xylosus]PTI00438.1 hypothetical protein BU099_01255 [Staphylococcus xylosus]RIM65808.1 DUF2129 domain-containing protein [Staphylococcus xylosus]RIM92906.1 DUF2129 domain-containing protein [Staphylococcus xylosus]